MDAIAFGDARARGMAEQEARLLALAEQARQRQHAANTTLVASLAEVDRQLLASRTVVDGLHDLREAVLRARLAAKDAAAITDSYAPPEAQPRFDSLAPSLDRVECIADRLAASLARAGEGTGRDGVPAAADDVYGTALAELTRLRAERLDRWTLPELAPRYDAVAQRVLDITGTGHGAVQAEVAELLRRTVSAHAMEQETQTVAMTALSLSGRTLRALERRDTRGLRDVAADSGRLRDRVVGLPISPLIQDEMLAAITAWRDGLERATDGLARQNGAIAAMDMDAAAVMNTARHLNDLFQDSAVRSAGLLRSTLLIGATIGLLFAAGAALLVAGGITRPLRRLQDATRRLAHDPSDGQVSDLDRRDELGDMARAVHHFAAEINRREDELRRAKEQADSTLAELRRTQAHLVQAEKLGRGGARDQHAAWDHPHHVDPDPREGAEDEASSRFRPTAPPRVGTLPDRHGRRVRAAGQQHRPRGGTGAALQGVGDGPGGGDAQTLRPPPLPHAGGRGAGTLLGTGGTPDCRGLSAGTDDGRLPAGHRADRLAPAAERGQPRLRGRGGDG
ncbi:HAMP domain-containing protein [Azospirillum brasilense]|uniref:HAMP domain-containing protein n=1 Tax=Azospirillum brasilense TaxID=192 RepID=UPI0003A38610|nr:HAMP domain-containing protein [Azospirillum brasilense]